MRSRWSRTASPCLSAPNCCAQISPDFSWSPAPACCGLPPTSRLYGPLLPMPCALPRMEKEISSSRDILARVPGGLPFFARFNANPDFRSEQLNGYELGYRRLVGPKLYFDVSAFFNHYSDLFSEDITGAPFVENNPAPTHLLLPAEFGNGLLGTTEGIEIAPEWRPTNFWRLRLSYSFLEMHMKRSPDSLDVGTAPIIEGSSPQHQVTAQSGFDISKAFTLDLTYRYVSALPSANGRGILHRRRPLRMATERTLSAFGCGTKPFAALPRRGRRVIQGLWWESREACTGKSRGNGDCRQDRRVAIRTTYSGMSPEAFYACTSTRTRSGWCRAFAWIILTLLSAISVARPGNPSYRVSGQSSLSFQLWQICPLAA